MPDKRGWRRRARALRHQLPDRPLRSELIAWRLRSLPEWRRAGRIFIYVSAGDEPATLGLIWDELILGRREMCVPLMVGQHQLLPVRLERIDGLAPGRHGILEPTLPWRVVRPEQLDLVVVPGLAFDRLGHRLGQGLGYYDRFLAAAPGLFTVGVAFAPLVVASLPRAPHDRPCRAVITEKETIRCR